MTKVSWTDLIGESVYTSDDKDIGDVEAVGRDFIVVKRGLVSVHRYYIPMNRVEGWDGEVVWLKVPEERARESYERDVVPDPHLYHYSNAPVADTGVARKFMINMPRIPPKYEQNRPFVVAKEKEERYVFRCDLCGVTFRSEDELSAHVSASH